MNHKKKPVKNTTTPKRPEIILERIETQPKPGSVIEQELACSQCGYKHTYNKALVTVEFLRSLYCVQCHKRTQHEIPKAEVKK